jgi:hypothetical protein
MPDTKHTVHFIGIFFITFSLFYAVSAFVFWVYENLDQYRPKAELLQQYVQKHQSDLKKDIFGNAFETAEFCDTIPTTKEKEYCHAELSRELALRITEEELIEDTWPHDLFFVKREGSNYRLLDWSGKLKDITTQTNTYLLESRAPYISKFLTRNCSFFSRYGDSPYYCEVFEAVQLENNDIGYVVRLIPLTEETWLPFFVVMPLFGLLFTLPQLSELPEEGWIFFWMSFSFVITPLLGAAIVTYRYYKQNTLRSFSRKKKTNLQ